MRRSKVQRQEERRERQAKSRQRGIQKKEKAVAEEGYIVVRQSDAAAAKYLTPLDPEDVSGFPLEHAKAVAQPVDVQVAEGLTFAPVRVGAWRMALGLDEKVTADEAEALYEKATADEDE